MWKNILIEIILLFILPVCFVACHDDEVIEETTLQSGPIRVSVPQNPWYISSQADFYMFLIESQGCGWTASTESEWLTLETAQGTQGSTYFRFSVRENTEPFARMAVITVTDSQKPDEYRLQVRIRQSGYNDEDNATLTGSMLKKHRMGYGYNVMKDYANDNSFSNSPILDYDQVVKLEEEKNVSLISEDRRHYQEIETFSGNTLTELAGKLTKNMTSGGTVLGCGKVTATSSGIFRSKTIEQSCGYIRLKQITSSRTVDLGALAVEANTDDSPLYSREFREAIGNMNSVGDASKVINTFGTHLVSSADLGGSISLEVLVNREQSIEEEHSIKTVTKKVFGIRSSQSNSTYDKFVEQNGLDYQASISCIGGTVAAQNAIKTYIDRKEQVPSSAIINWQNTFQDDPAEAKDYNVGMIGCQLTPIYTLVNNPTKRTWLKEAFEMYTNTQITEYEDTPATVYVGQVQQTWLKEGHKRVFLGNDGSGPRVLLANEYVPSIRTDKTVTVAYPVLNGKAFYYSGVFVGDEDHIPGSVRWLGTNPIYEPSEEITAANPAYSELFDNDTKSLKELYIYNGGVNILPAGNNGESLIFNYIRAPRTSTPLIKIGNYLWGEETSRYYLAHGYEMINNYYYHLFEWSDPSTTTNIQIYSLPDYKALQNLVKITTAYSIDILFKNNNVQKNEVGIRWPKGFWVQVYSMSDWKGEYYEFDTQAFILPVRDSDTTVQIGRCSPSKQASLHTPKDYFLAVDQASGFRLSHTYVPVVEAFLNVPVY